MEDVQNDTVAVIVLNWNTWKDTIECLETVLKSDHSFFSIFLIDNCSENDSIEKINKWAHGKFDIIETKFTKKVFPLVNKPIHIIDQNKLGDHLELNRKIIFVKSNENLGFAKANNYLIKLAKKFYDFNYYFLLNNDTIVNSNAISELVSVLENDRTLGIASSTVFNYYSPEIIDQAGGKIKKTAKPSYYKKMKKNEIKNITFVNGCAMMLRAEILEKYGLLTEKFFFGEEDMEFSLRMNKYGIKMVSVANSHVYHKIGTSSSKFYKADYKRAFIHRLNRLVDMKDYFSGSIWLYWKYLSLIYFLFDNLFRFKFSPRQSLYIVRKLDEFSNKLHSVRRENIDQIMQEI